MNKYPEIIKRIADADAILVGECNAFSGSKETAVLRMLIRNMPSFIVTFNSRERFELAGFDKSSIYQIQESRKCLQTDSNVSGRLKAFVKQYHNQKLVILEFDSGKQNQLIREPFLRLAAQEPKATYIAINSGTGFVPGKFAKKSFVLNGNAEEILENFVKGGF